MRIRSVKLRSSRLWRGLTLLATGSLAFPLQAAVAAPPLPIAHMRIVAPHTVPRDGGAELQGLLTAAGRPLADRDVVFVSRQSAYDDWHTVAVARTDFGGWASWHVGTVPRRTDFGVYFPGLAHGIAASRTAAATVHVIDVAASAPHRVRAGHPARLAGRLTMDGRALAAQPVHFMFRNGPHHRWYDARWDTANQRGWARIERRFRRTFQVGVRFEGADGLSRSPLDIATVRVIRPQPAKAAATGFVFPFKNPGTATPSSAWTQDQGVDLAANGYACGSAAVLVAVGDGQVIQEGIDGFGPTAPVLRMTSGPFAGRNVYYGHTGRVFVHVGDTVHAGQRLAEVGCGSVGYSQAPHLEIGVGVRGGPSCCPAMHQTSAEMWHQLVASRP